MQDHPTSRWKSIGDGSGGGSGGGGGGGVGETGERAATLLH